MSHAAPNSASDDLLWVPLLTHYSDDGRVDAERTLAHLKAIRPGVRQLLLAGSTGDGWEIDEAGFDALIDFAASDQVAALDVKVMFGILRSTTDEVISRLKRLESRIEADAGLAARFSGVAVCPPVDASATQDAIRAHYQAVFDATTSPIAVYELPQVTGCSIAPETFAELARSPRVVMFKDSSGADKIAGSGLGFGDVVKLRGAEGGYLEALGPKGPYDGWLLSTGNVVAEPLRRILSLRAEGKTDEARAVSEWLGTMIGKVFEASKDEGGANAFSNANHAMDHIRAYGRGWKDAPRPVKVNGERMSAELLENVARAAEGVLEPGEGYLRAGA